MFSLFKPRRKLPESFERWSMVDIIVGSESLSSGPSVTDVLNLEQWLDKQECWQAAYAELLKAEQTLVTTNGYADDFDRRQHEHYAALLLQSGQWHAILLKLIEDMPEAERLRHLENLDACLNALRQKISRGFTR